MAVTVHDRNGDAWEFARGRGVEVDHDYPSAPLYVVGSDGYVVGGFNSQAWTHFEVKPEETVLPTSTGEHLHTVVMGGGSGADVPRYWIKKK
ncbi:hypothetical protein PBI_SEANDERSON_5 [Mycobacterium phage Seanderson]|nr:hypothetical protein PBI_SEANDERSON_5 [Mycobacterium phage Seanderson]